MPYEFPVDIVSERNPVIEITTNLPLVRRQAGWIYSSVDTSYGDDEIGESHNIMFGKNRCSFQIHPLPYRLKFYPTYGLKAYSLKVYSGVSWIEPGTQLNVSYVARLDTGLRGGVIQYKSPTSSIWTNLGGMGGIAQAYYFPTTNTIVVRCHTGEIWYCVVGVWTWISDTLATLRAVVSTTTTRSIMTVNTRQF
jgi:hypothetical protein